MLGYLYKKRFGSNIFEPNLFPHKYPNILSTSHSSYLPAYEDGTDRVFQNIGISNSEAVELPRRKHTNIWLLLDECPDQALTGATT
jgi:hypothetical protein